MDTNLKSTVEKAIYIPREQIKDAFPDANRFYIGSHTCIFYLPDIKNIPLNAPITLIIPPVPEKSLDYVKNYIQEFVSKAKTPEIVFNDWGIFYWFTRQKQFVSTPKIIGFILTHQKRDPYAYMFKESPLFTSLAEDNPIWASFLEDRSIMAVEVTSTLQTLRFKSLKNSGIKIHTYTPFSFLSATRYCPLLMMDKNQKNNKLPARCDRNECLQNYYVQEIDVEGRKIEQYYIGNAQYYKNKNVSMDIDRLIDNSKLVF